MSDSRLFGEQLLPSRERHMPGRNIEVISFPSNSGGDLSASTDGVNTPVRALIAEPDAASRRLICSMLDREPDVSFQCIDNSDLVAAIQDFSPDLLIVDTHNAAIRRAANWEALGVKSPLATIVTSYDRTALMPFASSSTDLLIKPFNVEEFGNAMEIARSKIINARAKLNELRENNHSVHGGQPKFLQRLAAELEGKIVLIKLPDVLWLQSFGNYIRVHSASTTHLVRSTLKRIQPLLDPSLFLRIHRNAIVNLDHVIEFILPATGNMFVRLDNGLSLPLRRSSRASLRNFFKRHSLV
jgi:two-component system, LytTR family, response regulator